MTDEVYHSMEEFEQAFFPRLVEWREKQKAMWEGHSCDRCGCEDALRWCPNRWVMECRFCGGAIPSTHYRYGGTTNDADDWRAVEVAHE